MSSHLAELQRLYRRGGCTVKNGCVVWRGDADDYPRIRWPHKSSPPRIAHRVAWCLWADVDPAALSPTVVVRHACRNRRCVNPLHLLPGSAKENVWDSHPWRDGTCVSGRHDVTDPANVYVSKRGLRECKPCARERARVWRAAHAAARQSR